MNDDFFNKENNMKVAKNTVVSIAYQVRTQDGVLVDEAPANQPLEYLQGHNNLIIGLENALEGKEVGDKFEVRVQPEEGYGEYNENMVQRVPKDVFQGVDEVVVGMRFLADTDIGPVPVVITEVDGDEVVVDGNHMLAGQELHFTVEVVGTREATLEEIAHGHVHGAHDHHHHHHPGGVDPHTWSSISGAKVIAKNTLDAFVSLDPENKEYYQANYEQLTKEIGETEKTVSSLLHSLDNKTFIIYHPALTYLANEYGLTQLCIEMDGKEPSPAQLKELVETAREHNAKVVFIQREFDQKNAELIAKETGCRLIPINPLDYDWGKEMIHIAKSLVDGQAD